jgi:hypothetical protein
MNPKDKTDQWIQKLVPGKTFADIGGIGVKCCNERITFAAMSGAAACTMADIRPADFHEWDIFRKKCADAGVRGVRELAGIDVRDRRSIAEIGKCDLVHSTGILYHVQSPAQVLWNLRSVTSRYLITNTVIFPRRVENAYGVVEVPDHSVLFTAALSAQDRLVLNAYYKEKFGWTLDGLAPDPDVPGRKIHWIENGELTCWPIWHLFSDGAFRALLRVCRLKILDEWNWQDHCLQVLCERCD